MSRFCAPLRPSTASAALALALLLAIALPTAARADVGMRIIERCAHGQAISGFTVAQYRRAQQEMPTEIAEYTDCGELISQAELKAAGHRARGAGGGAGAGGGGGPAGGSGQSAAAGNGNQEIPLTPAELHTVEQARHGAAPPVRLGGGSVLPGVVHADIASAASSLPAPLMAAIALTLAGLLLLAGFEVKDRIARLRAG